MGLYRFYGRVLDCPFELRSLPPADADNAAAVIRLVMGEVPEHLSSPVFQSLLLEIDAAGDALIRLPRVGRILLQRGMEITVSLAETGTEHDLDVLIAPTIAGILLHQRGVAPLHAAVVETEHGAVMLCGASCTGKSSVAAALVERGAKLLCDDLATVTMRDGGIWCEPGSAWLRLWPDMLDQLQIAPERRFTLREGQEKSGVAMPAALTPVPLRAIVMLQRHKAKNPKERKALTAMDLFGRRPDIIYADDLTAHLHGVADTFAMMVALARVVPLWSMPGPARAAMLDECADEVIAVLEGRPPAEPSTEAGVA